MAEESPISPISEAVPPKANPLASPATAHAATLKLKPVIRPGVKLPPKPGIATAGLKLPTQTAVRPNLKLPTKAPIKPGLKLPTQNAVRPGLKLPTKPGIKPIIRKPGAAVTGSAPALTTPTAGAAAPEAAPVEAPKPLEQLKAVTQNLKTMTAQIPQQAILRQTGIIASNPNEMSDAQKQAAKSKTARISLSDAIGVSPVKNEALPMKTIRIKRPDGIPGTKPPEGEASSPSSAEVQPAAAPKPVAKTAPAAAPATTFTQRKTLKISRPSASVRPTGKFGLKKPATTGITKKPTVKPAPTTPTDDVPEIADIPDVPTLPTAVAPIAPVKDEIQDVPKAIGVLGVLVQTAACVAMGALMWFLFTDAQLPQF